MSEARSQDKTQLVFVDGIGGRRYMRRPLFRQFAGAGHAVHYFDYRPSRQAFGTIEARLRELLRSVAAAGPYVVIGYSFGGVLARSVLAGEPGFPLPQRLFLIASPVKAMRLCEAVRGWRSFRWLTGECGQLVATPERMQGIGLPAVPTSCLYGTRSAGALSFFSRVLSDGMVAVDETCAERFEEALALPVGHPFIATCKPALALIAQRLADQRLYT